MDPSTVEICVTVAAFTVILYLLVQVIRWFYVWYLHQQENVFWMLAEQFALEFQWSCVYFCQTVLYVVGNTTLGLHFIGVALHFMGCMLLALGGLCLQIVRVMWAVLLLPFSFALTCLLFASTVFCSIPGILYGLCWAARDVYVTPLTPSHTLRGA